ncbi:MAG: GtrA family protein [Candidatus Buchananbacteria bacterium]
MSEQLNWLRQVIKFGIVGITNIALDMAIYYFLTRFFHVYYILAATISFIIVVTWSFNLNKRWTFRNQKVVKKLRTQYFEFFVVNILILLMNAGVLFALVDIFELNDLMAKIVASIIIGLVNFFINKFWTFGNFKKLKLAQ